MATLKFILQSKNVNAPIYARLSVSKFQTIKRKTREKINPDDWDAVKGAPKNRKSGDTTVLDSFKLKLSSIESFILNSYNQRNETEIINGDWLNEILEAFYNGGRKIEKLDLLTNYLDYYEENILPFRRYKGSPITSGTKKKQKTIIKKLKSFLQTLNKNVRVSDYGETMGNQFLTYLRGLGNLSENTLGKDLKYTKTIIKDAYKIDIQTNKTLDQIKGFTVETPTVIFTPEELETIQKLNFLNERWEITRDWLIIGCYTGQRAGDLFSMKKEMITKDQNNRESINLIQAKVKARVKIPIGKEVKKVLEKYKGNFPPVYSQSLDSNKTIFNRNLKQIAERAGIDRLDNGRVYDKEQKKYIFGKYPLYKLVSSHLCRRTFATMYYGKIPTPVIMSVTKHKTETEFLKYIGKDSDELTSQMFDYWEKMEIEKIEDLNNELKNAK